MRQVLMCVVFLSVNAAVAEVPSWSIADADEARLSAMKTLRIPVEGCITGSFERACVMLRSSNLLEKIQQAYAAQLPVGAKPEFQVKSAGAGRYFYVNKFNERCDIRELWRMTDTNTWFRCAFYVSGERSFGLFESLIYMTVRRDEGGSPDLLRYTSEVRVWPHGAFVRMLLRYMPGIECYFRAKTAEMRGVMTSVFLNLAGKEMMQLR